MARFLTRCGHCVLPLLRAIDILGCTIWLCLLYPWGLADRPTGRQLVSGYVGKAAHNEMPWGIRMARVIDWCARRLGDGPDHCRRAFMFWHRLEI
jgi:hypothetical protein